MLGAHNNLIDLMMANEALTQATAEAISSEAKDRFLGVLSHELKTPLTTILSLTQMLRMGKFDSEQSKKAIELIEHSAKTQERLVNDLLDVSRIIAGKISLSLGHIAPSNVILTAIDLVRPIANKKSITIISTFCSPIGLISADPMRLQQVICNLLTNAVKFSSEWQKIEVRLEQVKESTHEFACIKVIDEGKGLSPEFIPNMFKQFSQADDSCVRTHGGLGLGLSLSRSLVELHGGTLQAESPGEGKGSTFTIKIPIITNNGSTAI
jgi:signal transduction histidine kinase